MNVQTIEKDGKPEYVVLPWTDYQAMLEALEDVRDAALLEDFAVRLAAGEEETVPAEVAHAILDGANPLKVWREHRGLTQAALATAAGVTQSMVAMIERGERRGGVATLSALARALGLALGDLVIERAK